MARLMTAALLLQLFMTGLYAPGMAVRAAAGIEKGSVVSGGQTRLICSSQGLVSVSFDAAGNPLPPPSDDAIAFCPICFGLADTPMGLAVSFAYLETPDVDGVWLGWAKAEPLSDRRLRQVRARGPPLAIRL